MALATGYTDFDGLHGVRRDFSRIYGSRMGPRYNRQTTFAEITRRASCDARSPNHWTDGFYFTRYFHAYKMPGCCLNTLKFRRKGQLYLFEFQFKQRIKNGLLHRCANSDSSRETGRSETGLLDD